MLNFHRPSVALVFLFSLALLFLSPIARADVIPKGLVQADTLTVLYIDLTKADSATLRKTAAAIVGDDALKKVAWFDALLKHSEGLVKAGVTGGGIVWSGPRGDFSPQLELSVFLNLKAGVDTEKAAEQVEAHLPPAAVILPIRAGELVFEPESIPSPDHEDLKDHAKRAVFEKHLAGLGDAAVKIVVMSSEAAAKKYERPEPKRNHSWSFDDAYLVQRALRHRLASTNLITVAATAGAEPKIHISIEAQTEKAAMELVDELRVTLIGLRGLRANSLDESGYEEPSGFVVVPLLRALRPKVEKNIISIELTPESLKKLGPKLLLELEQREEARKELLMSVRIKLLTMEMIGLMHETGKYPDSFDDLRKLGGDERVDSLLKHPHTGEKVGFQWIKPGVREKDVKDPENTIVVVELRGGKVVKDGWHGDLNLRTAKGPAKPESPKR